MTITIAVGTRLPAYATSMGRVLLAGLEPDALAERLERIEVERLTATTVPNRKTLRQKIEVVREAGWAAVDQELEEGCARRPFRFATAPGRRGRTQRVGPCHPYDDAGFAPRGRAQAPPDGGSDRSRPPHGGRRVPCDSRIGVLIANSEAGRSVR